MSELLTITQTAEMLDVSTETVMRKFSKEKGVIDIGSQGSMKKRRYRVLRIPSTVVEKYLRARGASAAVTTPEKKKPVTSASLPNDVDEGQLTRQLAAVAKQNGTAAQKTLDKIAERARLMQYVPQDLWSVMVWFDEEEDV
jgi:hypothetical protein